MDITKCCGCNDFVGSVYAAMVSESDKSQTMEWYCMECMEMVFDPNNNLRTGIVAHEWREHKKKIS